MIADEAGAERRTRLQSELTARYRRGAVFDFILARSASSFARQRNSLRRPVPRRQTRPILRAGSSANSGRVTTLVPSNNPASTAKLGNNVVPHPLSTICTKVVRLFAWEEDRLGAVRGERLARGSAASAGRLRSAPSASRRRDLMPAERTATCHVREVLRLKFVGGVPTREIARRLQTSDRRTKTIPSAATFHTRERSRKTPAAYKAR